MWKISVFVLTLCVLSQAANLRRSERDLSSDCPTGCRSAPMDISLVVDASRSIGPANFAECLDFIEDFAQMFEISPSAVRMSMVTYGERAYPEAAFGLDEYDNAFDLVEAIASTHYMAGGATNTSDGIWYMLRHHFNDTRPGVRHIAMVITDGQSQNKANTKLAAADAKNKTEVYAIGVGSGVSVPELHMIASNDRHVFRVDSYDMLKFVKKRLAYQACDVPTFPECEMDPVDIAFVIDSSRSIGADNFTKGINFVRDFVDEFQVGPNHVRFAAVTYGEEAYMNDVFRFNDLRSKQEVLDRLNQTIYQAGGATYTWEGIQVMKDDLMADARSHVPHIAIVITDGESQSMSKTLTMAAAAKDQGIVMFAIGVGQAGGSLNQEELNGIASGPENVKIVRNYQELHVFKDDIVNVTCDGILRKTAQKNVEAQQLFELAPNPPSSSD